MATPSLAMIPSGYKASKLYSVLPNNGDGDFTFNRDSFATRVGSNGLIQTSSIDQPRLDYTDGACPSLLLEPASTNLRELSEDFSSDVTIRGTITLDGSAISPSGISGVDYLTSTGANGLVLDSSSIVGDGTFSVYLKRKTGVGDVRLSINGGVDYTNVSVTSEWGRFWLSSTSGLAQLVISLLTSGDEVYIWGWQAEELSYPTSYIPTSGQSGGVTRTAETCINAGDASTFNSTEGVLYVEMANLSDAWAFTKISISDGSESNSVFIGYNTTSDNVYARVFAAGTTVASFTWTGTTTNFNKMAIKWKSNDFALWINGVERETDSIGNVPAFNVLNTFNFNRGDGGNDFYGKVKDIRVYNTALTDDQLETLTTL